MLVAIDLTVQIAPALTVKCQALSRYLQARETRPRSSPCIGRAECRNLCVVSGRHF